jgi:uncharacterized secreted repeat protein (TIGR03808 family)
MLSRRTLISFPLAVPIMRLTARAESLQPQAGNDTQRLQQALDVAARGSGIVQLAGGTFETGTLEISTNVVLQGVPGSTVLKSSGGASIISAKSAKRVTIQGISFLAKGIKANLVTAEDVEWLTVSDCGFVGGAAGLRVMGCGGRIEGNRLRFHQQVGIHAFGSKGLTLAGNTISDIANNGIQVWGDGKAANPTIINGNFISRIATEDGGTGQNGNGINAYKSNNVIISNNHVTDCAFSAIRNNASDMCIITGNNIARCNEVAMYCEFEFYGGVVANNIIDTVSHGIAITNFLEGGRVAQCTGNVLRNLKGFNAEGLPAGGGIAVEAETIVANNVIENADIYGIALGWGRYGRNLVATSNILRECRDGIRFSAIGPGPYVISNNIIAGSSRSAIVGMDHDKPMTGDLSAAGAIVPEMARLSGNEIRS